MAGGDSALGDQAAHELAVFSFGGEVDRRRRAFFLAVDFAQVERLADMARRSRRSQKWFRFRPKAMPTVLVTSFKRPTPPITGAGKIGLPLVSL